MHSLAIMTFVLGLLAAGPINAYPPVDPPSPTVEPEPLSLRSQADELAHLIDLWHDANLKADNDQIRKWQNQIITFLHSDIERTRWRYDLCRKRVETISTDGPTALTPLEQSFVDQLSDADQWLKVKKRLLRGFEKGAAFSNRYRLLGDYLQVLRLESDRLQVNVADIQSDTEDDPDRISLEGADQ